MARPNRNKSYNYQYKNPTWFIEGEGGGTLKSLAERLDYPPEYDTNEPEPLNISKADTGLEERQRKLLKEV